MVPHRSPRTNPLRHKHRVAAIASHLHVHDRISVRLIGALLLLIAAALALPVYAGGNANQSLTIHTAKGAHYFNVELANTPAARSRGLMFRPHLPANHGMLFDFGADDEVTMWMQNTPVSLDMIFLTADGQVHRIARNTTPYSQKIIASRGPVRAVLEVVAGTARRIGLKPGDRIEHPMFPAAP